MRRIRLWQERIEAEVDILGDGPPVVYLHGPWGRRADGEFLRLLADGHRVYAPKHPGTTASDPDAVSHIENWWDLILYYGELFDRLGLDETALVGHSFGGMLACELAAAMPRQISSLMLIDPLGLWRDDLPVKNWMIMPTDELRTRLFAEPDGDAAKAFFAMPEERQARAEAQASFVWAQACTGKFVWPIPDKGLKRHIHRIVAPTLVLWGANDGIISIDYAKEFAARIEGARVQTIERAGHLPQVERPEQAASLVRAFLA